MIDDDDDDTDYDDDADYDNVFKYSMNTIHMAISSIMRSNSTILEIAISAYFVICD